MWWHRHTWELQGVHYTPPSEEKIDIQGAGAEFLERLIRRRAEGVTHFYQRCSGCGLVREESVFGKYEPTIEKESTHG